MLDVQFSINRIHMDIYQFSKYQNISDRLKRLANNTTNHNKDKLSQTLNHQSFRQNQNGNLMRKDNYSFEQEIRPKYGQNNKYANLTQQKKFYQEYEQKIKQFTSPIQNKQLTQQRLRKSINTRLYQKRMEKVDQKSYTQKQTEEKEESTTNRKTLEKVRSEGTIKIEEILQSFNNYKQNKQKFISTLARKQTAQTEYTQQQPQKPKQQTAQRNKNVFNPIENIWNEQQDEDNHPKFKRSLKSFRDGYEQLDVFNVLRQPQMEMEENKPKNFSKSKLIQRNIITSYQPQITEKSALKTLLSPRSRIPGKICKNKDRQ